MDATTEQLVNFALDAEYHELTAETVHECKRRLIDAFASAIGAYEEPLSKMARAIANRYTGNPGATIWGTELQTSPEAAAFANGVMLRYLDVSDTYLGKGGGHPSDIVPAILAVGESTRADGRSVINAMVLAYDVYCSLMDAADIGPKGWDQTLYGVLGCVIGAGKLLHLSRDQMANAISLALTPNMALRETRQGDISGWKGCAGANAGRNALFAAALAQEGFTGPPAPFEGKQGLWNAIGHFKWQLPVDRGSTRLVSQTHLKSLPVCYHGQSAVFCALELRERVRLADISEIRVESYRGAVAMMGDDPSRWAPTTRETADHSMPYVIAIALLDGDVTVASFTRDRMSDPRVLQLMGKVQVEESPDLSVRYPESAPSRLSIRMSSGEVVKHEISYPKGHNKNPMTDAELELKFRAMLGEHTDVSRRELILKNLWDLETSKDIGLSVIRLLTKTRS